MYVPIRTESIENLKEWLRTQYESPGHLADFYAMRDALHRSCVVTLNNQNNLVYTTILSQNKRFINIFPDYLHYSMYAISQNMTHKHVNLRNC